jgi:hypothetical protein
MIQETHTETHIQKINNKSDSFWFLVRRRMPELLALETFQPHSYRCLMEPR